MNYLKESFPGQVISGQKKIIFNAGVESSINYTNPNNVYSPRIQLLFSPFGLPFVPIEIIGTNVAKTITNLNWTKDRNNPGGLLQTTITPNNDIIKGIVDTLNKYSGNLYSAIWGELGVSLEDLFKPMTLCQLWVDGYHICTGYVRSCVRSSSVENESYNVSYNLIVEELGNIYNLSTTSLDFIHQDQMQTKIIDSVKKALALTAKLKGVTASQAIQLILNSFISMNQLENVNLSDGFPLSYRLLSLIAPLGGLSNTAIANYMTIDTSMYELNSANGSQSVWSFLQSFIPSPWMEFFTESGGRTMVVDGGLPSVLFPGFSYSVSRTTPYSNPLLGAVSQPYFSQNSLFELNTLQLLIGGDFVIVTDDIIKEKTLGIDSINQKTHFRTIYTNKSGSNAPDVASPGVKSIGPLNPFASGGISTFGIREMCQTIDITSLQGLGLSTSYIERIVKNIISLPGTALTKNHLSNILAIWFRNQSRFREGTITTAIPIPWARAGMYCLYLPSINGKKVENIRDIGIYYIDSISHNYSIENESIRFNTILNVIRGLPLPTSIAKTAMLLFDFEVLPPELGLGDGEYRALQAIKESLKK